MLWEDLVVARMLSNGLWHALLGFCVLQVGNLGLLFMLLFFIYAALGVELFGELGECTGHPVVMLQRSKVRHIKSFLVMNVLQKNFSEDFSFGQILLQHLMDYFPVFPL